VIVVAVERIDACSANLGVKLGSVGVAKAADMTGVFETNVIANDTIGHDWRN
jgi:hypothetical protein